MGEGGEGGEGGEAGGRRQEDAMSATLETVFVSVPRMLMAMLILTGIAVNFANVISRYLFSFALYWGEEIMVFVAIWFTFIGAIVVTYKGAHLRMDLISARIGSPWREIVNGAAAVMFLVCGVFVVFHSYEAVSLIGNAGHRSVSAGVPMVVPHVAILVGFIFMVAAVVIRLRAYVKGRF